MVEQISVTILTKNSQKYLKQCLDSLKLFNEVIILDNGSTDNTITIASKYPNVKIVKHHFIGFGPLKKLACNCANNDWILSVDSDEIITKELVEEIKNINLNNNINMVYSIPRENYYKDRLIKCCGWHPDIVARLFNRKHTNFNNAKVHESLIIHSKTKNKILNGKIKHYPFDNIESLIEKMQKYSTLYAEQSNKTSSPIKAFTRALFAFLKNYIFQRGFIYGYEGLLISVSNANGVFYKYMKIYEKQRKND